MCQGLPRRFWIASVPLRVVTIEWKSQKGENTTSTTSTDTLGHTALYHQSTTYAPPLHPAQLNTTPPTMLALRLQQKHYSVAHSSWLGRHHCRQSKESTSVDPVVQDRSQRGVLSTPPSDPKRDPLKKLQRAKQSFILLKRSSYKTGSSGHPIQIPDLRSLTPRRSIPFAVCLRPAL